MDQSLPRLFETVWQVLSKGAADLGSIHPLIVHFPIALLSVAPLFIILGLIFPKNDRSLFTSALILLVLGTLCIFISVESGEIASEAVKPNPVVVATLDAHYTLAEKSFVIFILLSILFLAYRLCLPMLEKMLNRRLHIMLLLIFLLGYGYGLLILTNAAHYGGKLVHHHGIRTNLYDNEQ